MSKSNWRNDLDAREDDAEREAERRADDAEAALRRTVSRLKARGDRVGERGSWPFPERDE